MWAWFELYGWSRVRRHRLLLANTSSARVSSPPLSPRSSCDCAEVPFASPGRPQATVAKCRVETTKDGVTRKFYLEFDDGEEEWASETRNRQTDAFHHAAAAISRRRNVVPTLLLTML